MLSSTSSESILLAFANQERAHLAQLAIELQDIRDSALANARINGYLTLIERSSITYSTLSQLFNSEEGRTITMVHYSGHSSEQGLWVERDGEVRVIDNEPLFRLLQAQETIRLIFLNSCRSQAIADQLLKAGAFFVIGTSSKIKDEQAVLVARKFYEILGNSHRTIREAYQLTLDYFRDPLYNDNTTLRQLFRGGLDIGDEDEFPWLLQAADQLSEEQENWTLVPRRRGPLPNECNELYQIAGAGSATDKPLFVMISYARLDEPVKQEISKQLRVVYKNQFISRWNDGAITDPKDRQTQLRARMGEAQLVIILTSADYLNTAFWTNLMGPLLDESYQAGTLQSVIPFITKASSFQDDPFLGVWQGSFPPDGQPITNYGTVDVMCAKFVASTRSVIKQIKASLGWL